MSGKKLDKVKGMPNHIKINYLKSKILVFINYFISISAHQYRKESEDKMLVYKSMVKRANEFKLYF